MPETRPLPPVANASAANAAQTSAIACPKCGHANTNTASFCTQCHYVLIHRCPNCWHEQRAGSICEKCGLDMGGYWKSSGAAASAQMIKEENSQMEELARATGALKTLAANGFGGNPIAELASPAAPFFIAGKQVASPRMPAHSSPRRAAQAGEIECPKCGLANTSAAHFCTQCHYVLIHRCPNCWHEQREGLRCEKCGTTFALYGELQIEESMAEENRLWWAKFWAGVSVYVQVVLLPFTTLGGLLRSLILRIISTRFSNR